MESPASYGTIAIEEAVINPPGIEWFSKSAPFFAPGGSQDLRDHPITTRLADIHGERLARMDATGVDYMLLSLTSHGPQGEADAERAAALAREANDWLATEVRVNPARFGALASLAMHDAVTAAKELRRAVLELGMFGAIINDWQDVRAADSTVQKKYYDGVEYDPFWAVVEELDVPVYLHPRYPTQEDVAPGAKYGPGRTHLLGAGVQFHLDLSFHLYSICSGGMLDRFPKVQIVVGHLGEGIPFNLWRADHWYNKPLKKKTRPSKEDYTYYFTHNISVTTSGNFSTKALKFCVQELGIERCLYSIDYPYDTIESAQDWWKTVDLPDEQKRAVARGNAIRLFKLPLSP